MPNPLTLEEAKAEIQGIIVAGDRFLRTDESDSYIKGLSVSLDIFKRVQLPEPDEEGQSVLWLIREKKWAISQIRGMYVRFTFNSDGTFDHARINPIEEAKKLGWGGGE